MRVVIDKSFLLEDANKEDIDFLKGCTIFHQIEGTGDVTIIEQKIDLSEDYMEAFLDIVDWACRGTITLERYATGRYGLKLS